MGNVASSLERALFGTRVGTPRPDAPASPDAPPAAPATPTTPASPGATLGEGDELESPRKATLGLDAATCRGFARATSAAPGDERRVDVDAGNVRLYTGSDRAGGASIQVVVAAVHATSTGARVYAALADFSGFTAARLPPAKPLEDGIALTALDGSKLHYTNGKLLLDKRERTRRTRASSAPLEQTERLDRLHVELPMTPDFVPTGDARFTVTSSSHRAGAGTSAPAVVTDATLQGLTSIV